MAGEKQDKALSTLPTMKLEYYRSAIGFSDAQKRVIKGLGFRKLSAVREFEDTPSIRGMVAKVPHLVREIE